VVIDQEKRLAQFEREQAKQRLVAYAKACMTRVHTGELMTRQADDDLALLDDLAPAAGITVDEVFDQIRAEDIPPKQRRKWRKVYVDEGEGRD
jgi:hypothetical protein